MNKDNTNGLDKLTRQSKTLEAPTLPKNNRQLKKAGNGRSFFHIFSKEKHTYKKIAAQCQIISPEKYTFIYYCMDYTSSI